MDFNRNISYELRTSLGHLRRNNPLLEGIDPSAPVTKASRDDSGIDSLTMFGQQIWPPPPPISDSDFQRGNDLNFRVTSMMADALGPMYGTIAQQPREKNIASQSAEMGLGMGGHSKDSNTLAHPLTATSAYFSGDDSHLNADVDINDTAADVYNKRLELQRKHQARMNYSSAPTLTR